jgi:hypothetical protein
MKRKIVVEINCKKESCGMCDWAAPNFGCVLFKGQRTDYRYDLRRLSECKKAEVR